MSSLITMKSWNMLFASASVLASFQPAFASSEEKGSATAPINELVNLEVNAAGLQTIAQHIKQNELPDIAGMVLPDVDDTVDNGVEVRVTGLRLWAQFGDLSLTAANGSLNGVQQIIHIKVQADKIRLRKRVVGNWVSTTCDDTEISVGHSEQVHLTFGLRASVANRRIHLAEHHLSFPIPSDQYTVDGPRRCSGALGVGQLIRLVARSVLNNNRGAIEDAVERRVRDAIPDIANTINNTMNQTLELDLSQPPIMTGRFTAHTYPHAVRISNGLLNVTAGADIQRMEQIDETDSIDLATVPIKVSGRDIGAAGVNPTVVTEAFRAAFPQGTNWAELDNRAAPGLADALDVSSAAGIWPDLLSAPLTSRKLRLKIRMLRAPELMVQDANNFVSVRIPAFEMMFMAELNGAWTDYFKMNIDLSSGLNLQRNGAWMALHMAGPKTLRIGGNWVPGYTPETPIFESDVAKLIFSSIIHYLYDSGPLSVFKVPTFAIDGTSVAPGQISLTAPYIRMQLLQE